MFAGRTWDEWIHQYGGSHRHPLNRFCHTLGIPLIALSLPLFLVIPFVHRIWVIPALMFVIGWVLQFVGHAVEGKPPEFFQDWRFLFVGLRWWFAKVRGRA
ncbi:MAG: Mpo1-like protein [Steroidobacteraceae bacterium]